MEENIPQTQPTEIQNQPEKRWLKIVSFSVLGLVLAGGLVFAGYKRGQRQIQRAPVFPPTITPPVFQPEVGRPLDETVEWKTYADPNGRFTVKWKEGWYEPVITVIKKERTESLKELIASEDKIRKQGRECVSCFKVISEREAKVDKHLAIIREVTGHPEGKTLNAYILMNDEEVVHLMTCCGDPDMDKVWNPYVLMSEVRDQFNQILSTFRFLPSTSSGQEE